MNDLKKEINCFKDFLFLRKERGVLPDFQMDRGGWKKKRKNGNAMPLGRKVVGCP
jgi:hypothetical protein